MNITPYKRAIAALRGQWTGKVPFTAYEYLVSQCYAERNLRNRGLCIVKRVQSYSLQHPNVSEKSLHYMDDFGKSLIRTTLYTPCGELSSLVELSGSSWWTREYLFKTPDDYKALRFLAGNYVAKPCYEDIAKMKDSLGEDFILRDQIPLEPLQTIISDYMGTEAFCFEWMDNRDEVMRLYDTLTERNRLTYSLVADGPLEFANYGGNVVPQLIGTEGFTRYYAPHYDEAAESLHRKGKLIGTHLDADNTLIMKQIGETALDYIEAYDAGISPPAAEALRAWQGKSLWLNWPSAWHLNPPEKVYELTLKLLRSCAPADRILIGITEDVPVERWRGNFEAIMDAIDKFS
jgi:hypothetical protein